MAAESNRFFGADGVIYTARRGVSGGRGGVSSDATIDQLAAALRQLSDRVAELESFRQPSWTEFEVTLPGAGSVSLAHGYGAPVRFYVTHWSGAAAAPILYRSSSSTDTNLVLTSGAAGNAVVRVEKSQFPTTQ